MLQAEIQFGSALRVARFVLLVDLWTDVRTLRRESNLSVSPEDPTQAPFPLPVRQ